MNLRKETKGSFKFHASTFTAPPCFCHHQTAGPLSLFDVSEGTAEKDLIISFIARRTFMKFSKNLERNKQNLIAVISVEVAYSLVKGGIVPKLGLSVPESGPLVGGTDPDPSIIKQK